MVVTAVKAKRLRGRPEGSKSVPRNIRPELAALNGRPMEGIAREEELKGLMRYMGGISDREFDKSWVGLILDGVIVDRETGKLDLLNLARALNVVKRRYRRMGKR